MARGEDTRFHPARLVGTESQIFHAHHPSDDRERDDASDARFEMMRDDPPEDGDYYSGRRPY